MNLNHLNFLCEKFKFGLHLESITPIYGSRSGARLWRVNTDKGSYAIKQLAPDIDLKNESMIAKYELSETVAYHFSLHGIPLSLQKKNLAAA